MWVLTSGVGTHFGLSPENDKEKGAHEMDARWNCSLRM